MQNFRKAAQSQCHEGTHSRPLGSLACTSSRQLDNPACTMLYSSVGTRTYSLRHLEFLQLQCFLELPLLGRLRPRCLHHSASGQQVVMQITSHLVAVGNAGQCRTDAIHGYHGLFCMQCTWDLHICADHDILLEELYIMTRCAMP